MVTDIVNLVVFCALAVPPLFILHRRRDAPSAWLAAAFGALALVMLLGILIPPAPAELAPWQQVISRIGLAILLAYPYCLLRFTTTFDQRKALGRTTGALAALVIGSALLTPQATDENSQTSFQAAQMLIYVVYWVGLSSLASFRLWRAGRGEPTVTRRRMRLLSIATSMFSGVILISVSTTDSVAQPIRLLSLALLYTAALLVMLGVAPPGWLRSIWRKQEHDRIFDLQSQLISASTRDEVLEAALPTASMVFGNGSAAFVDHDGQVIAQCGPAEEVSELEAAFPKPTDGERTTTEPGMIQTNLLSGRLLAKVGRFAPVFGADEVRLFESVGLMVDTALTRVAANDALEEGRLKALEASRLKSEFLANMSHEIRTPMNGVIGMTDLLLLTDLNSEQREFAETVRSSGESLLTVINDILDFSKIEAGKVRLQPIDFDVRQLVEETADLLSSVAQRKGLELVTDIEQAPLVLFGDAGRFRQILLNLAGNAVKFTDEGEVVITCRQVVDDNDSKVQFEVSDTGVGIADDDQENLFESFTQVDATSTRRHEGTGLGLAIVQRLVDLMDGTVTMKSKLGEGSTFTVTVPMVPGDSSIIEAGITTDRTKGVRVLVVDDNATNRRILFNNLRSWDMRSSSVVNASEALVALRMATEASDPFELILLDFHMPDTDGLQLARLIQQETNVEKPKIILLTSSGDQLDRAELADYGVAALLTKPVRQAALHRNIVEALGESTVAIGESVPATSDSPRIAAAGEIAHVLVAEDNPVNQRVATSMLTKLGCEVRIAGNGAQAIEAIEAINFDLVFMDCQMPVVDGYEATRRIRQREGDQRHTVIIAMTANAMKGDREKCIEAGMDDYLAKPVQLPDLAQSLKKWMPDSVDANRPARQSETTSAPDDSGSSGSADVLDLTVVDSLRGVFKDAGQIGMGELVANYRSSATQQLSDMRAGLDGDDAGLVHRAAHNLKGGSASLGAHRVAELCQTIETAARVGDLIAARTKLPYLQDTVEMTIRALADATQ